MKLMKTMKGMKGMTIKKLAFFTMLLLAVFLMFVSQARADGTGASGNDVGYQVITSTGITVISFDRITTEIYVVNYTTNPAYINWVTTIPVNTNFLLAGYLDSYTPTGGAATTIIRGASRTEMINSSNIGIDAGTAGTPNIRVQWKMWRQ